ncbi:MAG: dicarboxylate/amino acid:cation symporter [Dermabacter sp.]|nr:dicarboxylate/amino acid:cation symporter [Dermabacter sp.]
MKKALNSLLGYIVIAIVLGILVGYVSPDWLSRIFSTFSSLFASFLTFIIPLIIIGLITPAIAEFGKGAGKWLGITALIAYSSTVLAGLYAIAAGYLTFPWLLGGDSTLEDVADPSASFEPFFTLEIPPVFSVMTALIVSFVVGLGIISVRATTISSAFVELRGIVNVVISRVIVPLLPPYIFCIFANMTSAGAIGKIIVQMLGIVILAFVLTVLMLIAQYTVAGLVAGRNPFSMLVKMLPAYATALGTSSSAATIPVTVRSAEAAGVSKPVAAFVIPLCATIHLAGSTVKIVLFGFAILWATGGDIQLSALIGFVLLLGIAMIAAPGVPGGAIVTASALLQEQLGFTEAQVGLMVATYVALDSFGTATNVTGDGAIATIVDKLSGGRLGAKNVDGEGIDAEPVPA